MLTVELVKNYAQQKFTRVSNRAVDFFNNNGYEDLQAVTDMMRLDGIVQGLSLNPSGYTYQDLEELLTTIQAVCDTEITLAYIPLETDLSNPGNPPVGGTGLYRGPWFVGAVVEKNTLWKYGKQLYASTRPDIFTSTIPPNNEGNTDWERVGLLLPGDVTLSTLSDEVVNFILAQGGGGGTGGSAVQPTKYLFYTDSTTFDIGEVPTKILDVELKSTNQDSFIPNSDLIPTIDYTHQIGTSLIDVIRTGWIPATGDYIKVKFTSNGEGDGGGVVAGMGYEDLPTGDFVVWDCEDKYISNRIIPAPLSSYKELTIINARNGLHAELVVQQNDSGQHTLAFTFNGEEPVALPISLDANTLTVLEGRLVKGTFIWSQVTTAVIE